MSVPKSFSGLPLAGGVSTGSTSGGGSGVGDVQPWASPEGIDVLPLPVVPDDRN